MKAKSLTTQYPVISDQVTQRELELLLVELEKQLITKTASSIVEFGCYMGTTSLFIRRLLDEYQATNDFHVYDSFAGLPAKTAEDLSPAGEHFRPGELSASKKDFILNFKKAGLTPPVIHKGWFDDLTKDDIPPEISFAFLDGDYYRSILDPLRLIWPRLVPGAVIVVDDYVSEALPGVQKAVDEWLRGSSARLRIEASLAIITV